MKNFLIWSLWAITLSSCSLFSRNPENPSEVGSAETTETAEEAPPLESEVARLNTKMSALETKLDVLSTSMERLQMQKSQPVIHAEPEANTPQANMAAPVDISAEEAHHAHAATETLPKHLPAQAKNISSSPSIPAPSAQASGEVEKEFRVAMTSFQNGKHLDSSSKFAMIAKKYPQHLLASHALYWAGEAGARAQQWSLAAANWEELESRYPRSIYLPEALAGLSRAYEHQGDTSKSQSYRDNLMRSFPKSPVALNFSESQQAPTKNSSTQSAVEATDEPVPTYEQSEGGHE